MAEARINDNFEKVNKKKKGLDPYQLTSLMLNFLRL